MFGIISNIYKLKKNKVTASNCHDKIIFHKNEDKYKQMIFE